MEVCIYAVADAEQPATRKLHPGDTAPPRKILDWLDEFEESVGGTSLGVVLFGDVPANIKRSSLYRPCVSGHGARARRRCRY